MRKNFTSYRGVTKSDLLGIFLEHILNQKALEHFVGLKQTRDYGAYQQKAGQYIFDLIAKYFTCDIRVKGLDLLRSHTPCLIAYPHKASILDGTLLNVLLLKEGFNSKAVARVSTDTEADSTRDCAYKLLSDFIIPLKQKKSETGYEPIKCKDMLATLRKVYAHYKDDGVVLVAPEGKTNPHFMMQAKEGLIGLSGKGRVPIVPCTVEYHEPLPGDAMAQHHGGVYRYITIEFHEAVRVDPKNKDEAGTLDTVMQSIAAGYSCRFKGGCYRPRPQAAPIRQAAPWGRHLKQIDEKFDPIYRYVHSADASCDQKQSLLYDLLEEEFDIRLESSVRVTPQARHPDPAAAASTGLKRTIKEIIAKRILHEEICTVFPPHMACQAPKATGPMAESARYQV